MPASRPATRPVKPVVRAAGQAKGSERSGSRPVWLAVAGIGAVVVAVVAFVALRPGGGAGQPSSAPRSFTGSLAPPNATPLTSPPAEPASSGVTATIETRLGKIVIEVFDESAPVSATNFLNLASAGYYNGTTFHRLVPNFVIQGGDPDGNGRGGPGYTIQDEPVVGDYARGIVAMARTREPNSQGSQFFIVLADAARTALDAARTYTIFGRVTSGMEVVDAIAAMPNAGSNAGNAAIDPVVMDRVTVQRP